MQSITSLQFTLLEASNARSQASFISHQALRSPAPSELYTSPLPTFSSFTDHLNNDQISSAAVDWTEFDELERRFYNLKYNW